jgi:hypothetical protein
MAIALPAALVDQPTAQYTYLCTDLLTNTVLGEIPATGVALDCQLNTPGNLTAAGNLNNPLIANDDFIARTIPGRTAFWAIRDTSVVWGGIIWTRQWETKGKVFSFTGQTFESYAARVFPRDWIGSQQKTYIENQCPIIQALWRGLQSVPSANIGVIVPPDSSIMGTDVSRTLTVNGWDLSTSFDGVIQSIIQFEDGPDYTIAWGLDTNNNPTKTLMVAPRLGNPQSSTDLVIDFPGAIQDYFYTEDATSGSNRWYAIGNGSGVQTAVGVATDQSSLDAGWPLLVGTQSYSDTIDQGSLAERASSDLAAQGMPLVVHQVDLTGNKLPFFGTYNMGDYLTANVTDARFESGEQFNVRVIGWSIAPPDTGSGVETITLVFDEPSTTGTVA